MYLKQILENFKELDETRFLTIFHNQDSNIHGSRCKARVCKVFKIT